MNLVSLLLVAALSAKDDAVVARVDDAVITRGAMTRRAELFESQGRRMAPAQIFDSLVAEALLAGEARRTGVAPPADTVALELRRAAVERLDEDLVAGAKIDDQQLQERFHLTADFARFSYLSYASEADAKAALERLRKGSDLATEARTAVESRVYASPAVAPALMRAQLKPALAAALFAARPGDLVGPAADETGWYVAVLLQKEIGSAEDFAARRPQLVKSAKEQMARAARQHLVMQLRAKSKAQVDEAFLTGLKGSAPTQQELDHAVATVNGAPRVRYADIWPTIRAIGGQSGHLGGPRLRIQLADQALDEALLQDLVTQRGVEKSPAFAAERAEIETSLLATAMALKVKAAAPSPNDREIEAFYKENKAHYGKPLAQVLPQVAADAAARRREDALTAHVGELRKKAKIVVEDKAIAAGRG